MKYRTREYDQTFEALASAIKDIQEAGVFPSPGVVQEALESRNILVDMDLDENSKLDFIQITP